MTPSYTQITTAEYLAFKRLEECYPCGCSCNGWNERHADDCSVFKALTDLEAARGTERKTG